MPTTFHPATKADWLARVERDLRGKPLSDLDWRVDGLPFTPFHHAEDRPRNYPPVPGAPSGDWRIGERITVTDFTAANQRALDALNKGAGALGFVLSREPTTRELTTLFADIQPEWMYTNFEGAGNTPALRAQWRELLQRAGFDPEKCGVNFDRTDGRDLGGPLPHLLAELIGRANAELASDHSRTAPAFWLSLDDRYFPAIATLRALRLLWQRVLEAWNVAGSCDVTVHIVMNDGDEHYNKIRATTRAMAAVIGGADQLFIDPSDGGDGTAFSRRVALNVQHLLRQEAHLGRVADPAAGSYFIENLTEDLATAAWDTFRQTDHYHA